jgi:hypothetical protein
MSSAFERLQKLAQQKKDQEKPKVEIIGKDAQSILPNIDNQPNVDNIDNPPNQDNRPNVPNQASKRKSRQPIAPEKDFTRVPNSVSRVAIPERLFRGMSKNTYDALYLKTRGAINPIRKIRATKSDLIRWTGVSDVTLDKHLKYLRSVGLINWEFIIGSHDGNWYEVFIPEEINLTDLTNLTNHTSGNQSKEVRYLTTNLVGGVGGGQTEESKEFKSNSKTSFKTNTSDDEAFAKFSEVFGRAAFELTGKKLGAADQKPLQDLAELLVLELRTAASRTDNVSNVPAFLTEVLRRQFFTARQNKTVGNSALKTAVVKPDTIGKSDSENFEIKPLDESGREAALEQLREFSGESFLEDFKKWYTPEDWQWLTENLKSK